MKKILKFVSSEFLANLLFALPILLLAKFFSPMTAIWLMPALFIVPYMVQAIKLGKITKLINRKAGKDYYLVKDRYRFSLVATVLGYIPFVPFIILSLETHKLLSNTTNWILFIISPLVVYILFVLFNPLLQKFSND